MKPLYEYLNDVVSEAVDISDWSDEDKLIMARSWASDNQVGYRMLNLNGKTFGDLFDEMEDKLTNEYLADNPAKNYKNTTHAVLNVIAHQVVDGMSYRDALNLEMERVKSDKYIKPEEKDFIVRVLKDDVGKDIKGYKANVSNQYVGFGSRKDMERRLKKIKADPKNLHKYLGHGF